MVVQFLDVYLPGCSESRNRPCHDAHNVYDPRKASHIGHKQSAVGEKKQIQKLSIMKVLHVLTTCTLYKEQGKMLLLIQRYTQPRNPV